MSPALRRQALSAAAVVHIAAVVLLYGDVSLATFNLLLASTVVPGVWLLWAFCQWSAHQHAARYARDVERVKGGQRPRAGVR